MFKNKFSIVITVISLAYLSSCSHSHHGKSNHFMHKKSTSELIKSFESEERDRYQEPLKVLDFIGNLKEVKIMDLGSGSGYFSFKLAKKGAIVISADVNEDFLSHIKKRLLTEPVNPGSIETRKILYDDPKLKMEEIDKVIIVNVYHHIDDRIPYLTKIRKGLKKNGEVILIDFFKKDLPVGPPMDHKISSQEVKQDLEKSGFQSIEINESLLKYQYIIRAK
jgi:2-polyprenyl-3-methyl-5-hydroxy-6-metoxy-1,4-benzoquinol methylase